MKLWRLEITSFVGTLAFGAVHTYGELRAPDTLFSVTEGSDDAEKYDVGDYVVSGAQYTVERVLDQAAADALNENDERWGRDDIGGNFKAGWSTKQFDSREDVIEHAVAAFRWLEPDLSAVLVAGNHALTGPAQPLAGPEDVIAVLQVIWELDESETSHAWTDIREQASLRWDEAIKRFDLDPHLEGKHVYGPRAPKGPLLSSVMVTKTEDGFTCELERPFDFDDED